MNDPVILLVEDNPDDISLVLRALKKNNVANPVVIAGDGQEALDYLNGTGPYQGRDLEIMPVLVLLGLRLPGMSGVEVLRQIRAEERTRGLPVVTLTSSKAEDERTLSAGGFDGYLRKSLDFSDLAKVLRQSGLYWLILNVPGAGRKIF